MGTVFSDTFLEYYLLPVCVAAASLILYLVANSFVRKSIAAVRVSIREAGVPFERLLGPFRLLFLIIGLASLAFYLRIPTEVKELLRHAFSIAAIVGAAWLMLRFFSVFEQFILLRKKSAGKDDLQIRRVTTHVGLIRKILNVIIIVIAVSGVLMTFDTVRQIGLSILASAGIAGIVMGFAAQRSLQTLIAGIQIAITQPIRIDDVVIVENETGRVEEITLTYVVVRLWDQRRLIVPITWFIDRPFQNWTRNSAELTGSVLLQVGYGVPVEKVRSELERIVAASPLWDRRVVRLEVTSAVRDYMELRALLSAADSSDLWALRCFVREKLIGFVTENSAGALPEAGEGAKPGPAESDG
jgi:small-conductance mechanosensitive channel